MNVDMKLKKETKSIYLFWSITIYLSIYLSNLVYYYLSIYLSIYLI